MQSCEPCRRPPPAKQYTFRTYGKQLANSEPSEATQSVRTVHYCKCSRHLLFAAGVHASAGAGRQSVARSSALVQTPTQALRYRPPAGAASVPHRSSQGWAWEPRYGAHCSSRRRVRGGRSYSTSADDRCVACWVDPCTGRPPGLPAAGGAAAPLLTCYLVHRVSLDKRGRAGKAAESEGMVGSAQAKPPGLARCSRSLLHRN